MIDINISKKIGDIDLEINLNIKQNDFVAISGISGSGKTTLLRILAGLDRANANIKVDHCLWQDKNFFLPIQKRDIGFVFQDYALFENMSVEGNLLYVTKDKELAHYLLKLTQLDGLKKRFPHQLSGGQKQRLALCRAFMKKPKLLLMDEPLSALDPAIRLKLQQDILHLHKKFKTTTILISHDPSEIYKLANRVLVLKKGKIVKDGKPRDVLLKTKGSQKFALEGELMDIIKADIIYIAIVAIGQQIAEIVLDQNDVSFFKIGQKVQVSTKAFSLNLMPID